MGRYAWVITRDHLQETNDPGYVSSVGVAGPSTATEAELERARTEGTLFRIYDDDGILNYTGRCWAEDGTDSEDGFGPLDDYGTPNAGAVTIKYRQPDGTYETLLGPHGFRD